MPGTGKHDLAAQHTDTIVEGAVGGGGARSVEPSHQIGRFATRTSSGQEIFGSEPDLTWPMLT
jgi:hypothetical protein